MSPEELQEIDTLIDSMTNHHRVKQIKSQLANRPLSIQELVHFAHREALRTIDHYDFSDIEESYTHISRDIEARLTHHQHIREDRVDTTGDHTDFECLINIAAMCLLVIYEHDLKPKLD